MLGVNCLSVLYSFLGLYLRLWFQAWVGHPYYDVIDNNTGFEEKVNRMISVSDFLSHQWDTYCCGQAICLQKFIVNVSIVGLTHVHVNIHHLSYSYNQVLDIYLLDTTWHSCEVWHTSKHVLFQTVCSRLGIEVNDRLSSESKKRKFLVKSLAPEEVSKLLQCLYSEHLFSCFCRELAIVP